MSKSAHAHQASSSATAGQRRLPLHKHLLSVNDSSRLLCTIIYSVVSRASDPLITILYLYLSIFIFSDQRSRQKYSKDHIRKTISSVVVSTHELA